MQFATVRQQLGEIWELAIGMKKRIFFLMLVGWCGLILSKVLETAFFMMLTHGQPSPLQSTIASHVMLLLGQFFVAPFLAGVLWMGIQRVRGSIVSGFSVFHRWGALGFASVITSLLMLILSGALLVTVLWGSAWLGQAWLAELLIFWLVVSFLIVFVIQMPWVMMSLSLIVDQEISLFAGLKKGGQMMLQHWGTLIWTEILMLLLNALGLCLLGIGLFWTVPMSMVMWGRFYTRAMNPDSLSA